MVGIEIEPGVLVGNLTVARALDVKPANVHREMKRGLRTSERRVKTLENDQGEVLAIQVIVKRRPIWEYHQDLVEEQRRRRANGKVRQR